MRRTALLAALTVAITACTAPATPPQEAIVEELRPIASQADAELRGLQTNVDQQYEDMNDLFLRIVDARLPNILAILGDRARRVEVPEGGEDVHGVMLGFLDRALSFAEDLDAAVAEGDLPGAAVAIIGLEASAADLALRLPPTACRTLAGERWHHLCAPSTQMEGYEAALDVVLRAFLASYEPLTHPARVFGDVTRSAVDTTLQPEALDLIDTTLARLDALDPGTRYRSLHMRIVEYFDSIRIVWDEVAEPSPFSDPLLHDALVRRLDLAYCSTLPAIEAEEERVVSAVQGTRIEEVTGTWFDDDARCARVRTG
jgi:hypothetical protein